MTKTWRVPVYSALKAIHAPSGEIFGKSSCPSCEVRRSAVPPDAEARQRSPA
jgi:hypothetical protein